MRENETRKKEEREGGERRRRKRRKMKTRIEKDNRVRCDGGGEQARETHRNGFRKTMRGENEERKRK